MTPHPDPAQQPDLRTLIARAWQGKWKVIAVTTVFAIAAVGYSLWLPNMYYSEALLAPADHENDGLEGMLAQFGGLASLAGFPLRRPPVEKTVLTVETLRSRRFLTQFARKHNMLVPLFAARRWNRSTGELIIDSEIYDVKTGRWTRPPREGRPAAPTDGEIYQRFSNLLSITQDKKTRLVTVGMDALSPVLARQWVDALVHDVNEAMRAMDFEEAEKSIVYLQRQLPLTEVADIQKVFYDLIEEQTKTMMLAQVRREYALKTIDPAVVPERKARPARALICIFVTLFGWMLGVSWALLTESGPPTRSARS